MAYSFESSPKYKLGSVTGRSTVETGGRSRMKSTGSPSAVTWFTGPSVSPCPCVKVRRSLTQVRLGRAAGIQLAGREHHLPELAVDDVAVVVHRREVVVGADLLDLPERLEQRLVIPETHVVERVAVVGDVVGGQLGVAGERPLLNRIEREGVPRGVDVVLDERGFADLFVGGDDEALDGARVELSGHDRHRIDADRTGGQHQTAAGGAQATASPAPRSAAAASASAKGMRAWTSV